jgi:hypothetical protein
VAWFAFFTVCALGAYVTRRRVKEADRIIAEAAAREAEARAAEAQALKETAEIRATQAARRGRPRKTTP